MILSSLLGPTSAARKVAMASVSALLLVLACLACAWGGYRHGRSTATAEGVAKYVRLEAAHAAALAEASARGLDRYARETERADTAAAALLFTRRSLDSTHATILKEIPHATADLGACAFGSAFLGVYSQALGYGAGAVPAAAPAGGAAGDAAAPAAADAGLR